MKKLGLQNWSGRIRWLAVLALALLALLIAGGKGPLEGVHWDVPIYLYQAKRFAETHFLANYVRHAGEIIAQVHGAVPPDELYSEAYWRFVRLGNIAFLGMLVGQFGSTLAVVHIATWLYTAALVAGLGLSLACVFQFAADKSPPRPWFAGAAISMLLFLLSDVYRYLAGNLISEALAILLLGAAVLVMLLSINRSHVALAALSGVLAFVSYTVRVESVWTWLAFLLAYLITRAGGSIARPPWKFLLTAAATAFCLYLVYAIAFYPLADPRHYLAFVASLSKENQGVPGYQLLFVAGGLLWLGALVSLRWWRQDGMIRLGWLWLILTGLPWLPLLLFGGPCQTRMMVLMIPPLMMLSTAGWSWLLVRGVRALPWTILAVTLALALFSQPNIYSWLHALPGLWRIQVVRPFFYVPKYERIDYVPAEMAALSEVVYAPRVLTILYAPPNASSREYLNLIRFFGVSYSPDSDLALRGDPVNSKPCDRLAPTLVEPVQFCSSFVDEAALDAQRRHYRLLVFRKASSPAMSGTTLLRSTAHYAVDQFQ